LLGREKGCTIIRRWKYILFILADPEKNIMEAESEQEDAK